MKISKVVLLPLAALLTLAVADDKAKWTAMFNGKDTSGWRNPYEWGEVKVSDGEVQLTAEKKFFLVTEKKYKDFIFEGEILLPDGQANSGFMFRCHVEPNKVFGYQAEVDGSDRKWSGGLYDEGRRQWVWPPKSGRTKDPEILKREEEGLAHFAKPEVKNALKRSDWNTYKIECRGNRLQIWVNGVQTTDIKDDMDAEGYTASSIMERKVKPIAFAIYVSRALKSQLAGHIRSRHPNCP